VDGSVVVINTSRSISPGALFHHSPTCLDENESYNWPPAGHRDRKQNQEAGGLPWAVDDAVPVGERSGAKNAACAARSGIVSRQNTSKRWHRTKIIYTHGSRGFFSWPLQTSKKRKVGTNHPFVPSRSVSGNYRIYSFIPDCGNIVNMESLNTGRDLADKVARYLRSNGQVQAILAFTNSVRAGQTNRGCRGARVRLYFSF
jgi:hypothetical protein